MTALLALLCAAAGPGDFVVVAGSDTVRIKDVRFNLSSDTLAIWADARPGVRFYLNRTAAGWEPDPDTDQEIWLTPSRGGVIPDLVLLVESQKDGRLQGRWSGSVTEANGDLTTLAGTFDIRPWTDVEGVEEAGYATASGIGCVIVGICWAIQIVCWVWLVIVAFQESAMWGIGMIVCGGVVGIIFAILHWNEAKLPFLAYLAASILGAGATFAFGRPF